MSTNVILDFLNDLSLNNSSEWMKNNKNRCEEAKKAREIENLKRLFTRCPQIQRWSVDLEDWEKVLRIESKGISVTEAIDALRTINIYASELE